VITIPTAEFIGLLGDVTPFAFPDDDYPDLNVVRLEWDGDMLHASATDTLRMVRSSWHPDDDEDGNETPGLVNPYGGADDRWALFMRLDDAKELIKHFKLPSKEGRIPLTLNHLDGLLKVNRSADSGHQEVTAVVVGRFCEFPDLAAVLDSEPLYELVSEMRYTGRHLADFGVVRQRGPMSLTFCGSQRATRVRIGSRFVGTIRPDRSGEPRMEVLA
jgi:hypothetical protein